MARNKLTDLNNILFAQLERLSDECLDQDAMKLEVQKAQAMSKVASQIVNNSKLALQAAKMVANGEISNTDRPTNLIDDNTSKRTEDNQH